MKDITKYENREQLYQFLVDDFGLTKVKDVYDAKNFGNFVIELAASNFLVRYVNDRSVLAIEVASKKESNRWIDLSFVQNVIGDSSNLDIADSKSDNVKEIEIMNNFLQRHFGRIVEWFDDENYPMNKIRLDKFLKDRFERNFPGMTK